MKFVSLISGGKDSVFNTLECVSLGHELVCIANLYPKSEKGVPGGETDSYMYQTVGVEVVPLVAQCLKVPVVRREIKGEALNQEMYYKKDEEEKRTDEVEDLFELLKEVKKRYPEV